MLQTLRAAAGRRTVLARRGQAMTPGRRTPTPRRRTDQRRVREIRRGARRRTDVALVPARRIASAVAALGCVVAVLASGAPSVADERERLSAAVLEPAREEFVAALRRAETGAEGLDAGSRDSERLQGYPLYPYLEAARIVVALRQAVGPQSPADRAAEAFVARHDGQPVVRDVRDAWLESLARRELWQRFLARLDAPSDVKTRCRAFRARIALNRIDGIVPDVVDVWLTGRQLPLDCEPVFQWLREEGLLTDELIERRVLLLLENGQADFARLIAGRLPEDRAAPLLRWADLIEQPRRALDELLEAPHADLPDGALEDGWQRLTRNHPADALPRLDAVIESFNLGPTATSRFTLHLALGLAWDRRPEALELFARVAADDLDDFALTWLARSAIWSGEWRLAGDAIAAMSAEQREQARWRYWAARVAGQTGERSRARELYRSVLQVDNYYSAMAAARLGEPVEPGHQPLPENPKRLARLAAQPPFVRARELLRARMPRHAAAEWRFGSRGLDGKDGRQSIHLAASWGWYDVAIATATSHRIFDDYVLLYPMPYEEPVASAARLTKLEPALIYAVIRRESLYRSDAVSASGALGLTQLLPDTARRAARRWNQPEPGYADLLVPETNVTLGAAELRTLIDTFGALPLALAGYNAGPNAARRWLPDEPLAADVWIENIPYNETREYVQRVLWHSLVFAWREDGRRARDTRSWLTEIADGDAGTAAAVVTGVPAAAGR